MTCVANETDAVACMSYESLVVCAHVISISYDVVCVVNEITECTDDVGPAPGIFSVFLSEGSKLW